VRTRRIALTILILSCFSCSAKAVVGLELPLYQFARSVPQEPAIEIYCVQPSSSAPADSEHAAMRAMLATRPALNATLTTLQMDHATRRESLPEFLHPLWELSRDQAAGGPWYLAIGLGDRILCQGELSELATTNLLDSPFRRRLAAELDRGMGLALAWIAADDPEQDAILGQRIEQSLREFSAADGRRQRLTVLRLESQDLDEYWTRRLFQILCERPDISYCGAVAVMFGRGRVWSCIPGDELTAKQLTIAMTDVARPVAEWEGDLPGVALPVEYVWSLDGEDRAANGATSHRVAKPPLSAVVPDAPGQGQFAPAGTADWFVRALPSLIAAVMAVFFWAIFVVIRSR